MGEDPGNEFDSAPAMQASLMSLLASCNDGNSFAFQLKHRVSNYMFVQSFSVITDTIGTRENVLINRLSLLGLLYTRDRDKIGNRKDSESEGI